MAEYDTSFKLHRNGSIDFDAYRADATRLRKAARDDIVRSLVGALLGRGLGRLLARGLQAGALRITDRTHLRRSATTSWS